MSQSRKKYTNVPLFLIYYFFLANVMSDRKTQACMCNLFLIWMASSFALSPSFLWMLFILGRKPCRMKNLGFILHWKNITMCWWRWEYGTDYCCETKFNKMSIAKKMIKLIWNVANYLKNLLITEQEGVCFWWNTKEFLLIIWYSEILNWRESSL